MGGEVIARDEETVYFLLIQSRVLITRNTTELTNNNYN